MEEVRQDESQVAVSPQEDVRSLMRAVIQEFMQAEQKKAEPAYKAELLDERRRREQLEQRLNEVVEENRRNRAMAEETERHTAIRGELQRLGVAKVDLAFKAIKDDIIRSADGRLVPKSGTPDQSMREYLAQFVQENPELLPARLSGGSGASPSTKPTAVQTIDLERIKPGMTAEELDRIRQEISRVAGQALRS